MDEPRPVSRLQAALRDIAFYLEREHRGWALVGGLAVSAHAEPRFTRDVDLAVATTDDQDAEARPADLDVARKTAALIMARGFGRDRNVVADLEQRLRRP